MVVDPHVPSSNMHQHTPCPQDEAHLESRDCDSDCDDVPEVIINAATQIRGTGNIVSIAQMDSVRIANLIASLLKGEEPSTSPCPSTPTPASPESEPIEAASPLATLANLASAAASKSEVETARKERRTQPKMHITLNCGATIIGDRNIVGPGLGDIARQMQLAQRNQVLQQQQQAAAAAAAQKMSGAPLPTAAKSCANLDATASGLGFSNGKRDTMFHVQASIAQHHGVTGLGAYATAGLGTPPMSRSASLDELHGVKRGREEDGKEASGAKRRC